MIISQDSHIPSLSLYSSRVIERVMSSCSGERVLMRTQQNNSTGARHTVTRSKVTAPVSVSSSSSHRSSCNSVNKSPVRSQKIDDHYHPQTQQSNSTTAGMDTFRSTAVVGPRRAIVIAMPPPRLSNSDGPSIRSPPGAVRIATTQRPIAQQSQIMSQSMSGDLLRSMPSQNRSSSSTIVSGSATMGRTPRAVRRSQTTFNASDHPSSNWDPPPITSLIVSSSSPSTSSTSSPNHRSSSVYSSIATTANNDQEYSFIQQSTTDDSAVSMNFFPSSSNASTPTAFRRSGVNTQQSGIAQHQIDEKMPTKISSTNKMIVAPQQQQLATSSNSHHRYHDQHPSSVEGQHQGALVQRRRSNYGVMPVAPLTTSSGRSNDATFATLYYHPMEQTGRAYISPDGDDDSIRVASLEQRVRELEEVVVSGGAQSSNTASLVIPVPMGSGSMRNSLSCSRLQAVAMQAASNSATQQLMAADIVDKEVEIERLQSQLRKCYTKMEMRQVQFDEEVKARRQESQQARNELAAVMNRLNEFERAYKDKASTAEQQRQNSLIQAQEKVMAQEKELNLMRTELDKASALIDELTETKRDLEWMELQNDSLSTTLDCKEQEIRELGETITVLKSGAGISETATTTISSEDDAEKTPTHRRSHQILPPALPPVALTPIAAGLLRGQRQRVAACRYTVKCLLDTATRLTKGERPNINRLLACREDGDSVSESDFERLDAQQAMSPITAENLLKNLDAKLGVVEKDLESIRQLFVDHYAKQMADDLSSNKNCVIQ